MGQCSHQLQLGFGALLPCKVENTIRSLRKKRGQKQFTQQRGWRRQEAERGEGRGKILGPLSDA